MVITALREQSVTKIARVRCTAVSRLAQPEPGRLPAQFMLALRKCHGSQLKI